MASQSVWDELDRRGASIAVVPFSGRAGRGGTVGVIVLGRDERDELVDIERWSGRDELAHALEDRYGIHGTFAGQVIEGERGGTAFQEDVS